jgi:predicted aspartyl protease
MVKMLFILIREERNWETKKLSSVAKSIFTFLLVWLGGFAQLHAQELFTPDRHLKALIDSGEYFQFRQEFEARFTGTFAAPDVETPEIVYFFAWDHFLFNNPKLSNYYAEAFLNSKSFLRSDSLNAEMLQLHFQNDIRLFKYKTADSICNILLFHYQEVIPPSVLAGIRNTGQITAGLVNVAPQTIERKGDLDIAYKRDLVHLIRIPVTMNKETTDFIFDTGANFSTISESCAKKMGVRTLNAKFSVTTSSRSALESKLGVADELKIGDVIFRNVVFIILPDKSLKFAGGIYKIKGIIGLPVIAQLKHIEITKDYHLKSTENYQGNHAVNLGMEGNTPFVAVTFFGTSHVYIFDTGAGGSALGNRFYETYKDSLTNAEEGTAHIGGAGGVEKVKTRSVKNVHYKLDGASGVLKTLTVQLSGITDALGNYKGIVGQDIFMQWNVMTMDFEKMYLELK